MGKNNGKGSGKSAKGSSSGKAQSIVCRLKRGKITLEVLCKPGQIVPFRENKMGLDAVILAEEIFTNASKFQKAKENEIKQATGGLSGKEALEEILRKGEFPLTKDELNTMRSKKLAEIVNYIHKNYHDPRPETPIPHPVTRIEAALNTMRIKIDPHEATDNQLKKILKTLPEHLPIKPVANNPTPI